MWPFVNLGIGIGIETDSTSTNHYLHFHEIYGP